MKNHRKILAALIFCVFISATALAQSGPPFEITQSVISNGGGSSDAAPFSITGTTGQPVAGTHSTGAGFGIRGGFWQAFLGPTAAMVGVSGRVLTAQGKGISKVRVTLVDAIGTTRTALTNPFGNFRFDEVEAGQTYVISVSSKRYQFAEPTQVVYVGDEITTLAFNALP